MSAILVKTETCHLHQLTEKTFLICHRRIIPQQMEIHFWCMIVVLPNENENTYNRLFEQLFQLVNNLGNGPNDILVDLERSTINAFQNRNIEVQGCFYHLSANIWKHTQHLGLSQRYNQKEEFALHINVTGFSVFTSWRCHGMI